MKGMYAIVNLGSCFTVMLTETYNELGKGILVETGDNYDALGKACDCLNDFKCDEDNERYFMSQQDNVSEDDRLIYSLNW